MKYPTSQDEIGLDRLYFYNLVKNPYALPPQGLDALTAEIIRRLVLGEQLAEVKSPYQLEPAKERVWHTIFAETNQPISAWPPVDPSIAPVGWYAPAGRPEPQPLYSRISPPAWQNPGFKWKKLIVLAAIFGLVLLAGLAFQVMFAVPSPGNEFSEAMPLPVSAGESIAIPDKPPLPVTKLPAPKLVNGKPVPVINLQDLTGPAIDDLAVDLKIDPIELEAQMETGLSFLGLAKSLNIDPEVIRARLLESFNRQLEAGLKVGKYSVVQVEQAHKDTPIFVDKLLNNGKN